MGSVVFSSSYSMSGYVYATYRIRVGYTESYDMAANQTRLRISSVELQKEGNGTNWGSLPFFGSIRVNGTTLLSMNGGSSVRVSLSGGGYASVNIPASSTAVIGHGEDGAGSVSFQLVGGFSYAGESYFCALYDDHPFGVEAQTKTVALTTHPRASAISSCPASAETLQTIALRLERYSPAFYHKACFVSGGETLYTSEAFASSLSWSIPRSCFSSRPNDATLAVTVSVQTYTDASCVTPVGSPATRSLSLSADAGMRPQLTAGWASLAPYNTGPVAGLSGCVRGYSRAQAVFDPAKIDLTDAVGASVASFSVSCQGETADAAPYLTPVLTGTSAGVVCTVTDSRGRTASESFSLPVMDYAPPTLSGVGIFRCGAAGTAEEDGAYISVKADALFASLDGQNACALRAAVAPSGGAFGAETPLVSGTAAFLGPFSPDTSYAVRLSAADALGNTAVYDALVPTRRWAMKFRANGRGVAFGKAAEADDCFEVSGDWQVRLGSPLPVSSGGTGADSAADGRRNLGAAAEAELLVKVLTPAAAFAAPAPGSSVSYDMAGLTAAHELVRWNFSSSAENAPPANLSWTTFEGYFTVMNSGGATAETIRPVFAIPAAVALTAH